MRRSALFSDLKSAQETIREKHVTVNTFVELGLNGIEITAYLLECFVDNTFAFYFKGHESWRFSARSDFNSATFSDFKWIYFRESYIYNTYLNLNPAFCFSELWVDPVELVLGFASLSGEPLTLLLHILAEFLSPFSVSPYFGLSQRFSKYLQAPHCGLLRAEIQNLALNSGSISYYPHFYEINSFVGLN